MAIDTEAKRKSIVSIGFMPVGPGLVIDGTIEAADRQAIGYSYAGILAAAANALNVTETSVLFTRSDKTVVFGISEKTVLFPRGRKTVQFEGDD